MELYVSANSLSSLRELFCLKSLSCLVVLDLTFNPVVSLHTYRPFVVFHLTFLKALDGRPIVCIMCWLNHPAIVDCVYMQDVNEIAGAKEKLGGQ